MATNIELSYSLFVSVDTTVSPVEARRRQRLIEDDPNSALSEIDQGDPLPGTTESKSERNEAAALVLAKVAEKLQGYEDGTSGEQQSIEGQVRFLINSARDNDNLGAMFFGWAPWVRMNPFSSCLYCSACCCQTRTKFSERANHYTQV